MIAFPLRESRSASRKAWAGVLHTRESRLESSLPIELDILDRVGGGDAFVSGLIHGLLGDYELQQALDFAVAHGALAMTTPGDNAVVSQTEVEAVARGETAAARR